MKLFLVFAAVTLAASASSDEELWMKFKQDHGKTYKSLREEKLRFSIFKNTLREIKEHNAKYEQGRETWYMGTNQFSDLTNEEFKSLYLSYKPIEHETLVAMTFNVTVPESIDWRSKGAVLSVKNQGQCGSCWAFSAVGAIEGQNAIKHEAKLDLSPQELVDCSTNYTNEGCNGGLMTYAFAYVTDHGLSTLADYPYKATDGSCISQKNSAHLNVTGFRKVAPYEGQLKQAVGSVGPVSVSIDAETIRNYKGGIYDFLYCGNRLTHGVLVVGYGAEGNHEFWIVKNSWGASWGDHGYIRMTRNKYNQCGIAWDASFPVLA